MATYVLIHGAGSDSWYWHLVVPELRARGHDVVAPDLPCDDDTAGFSEYADVVVEAIGDRTDLVVVAQSLGRVHRAAGVRPSAGGAVDPGGGDGAGTGGVAGRLVGEHRLGAGEAPSRPSATVARPTETSIRWSSSSTTFRRRW